MHSENNFTDQNRPHCEHTASYIIGDSHVPLMGDSGLQYTLHKHTASIFALSSYHRIMPPASMSPMASAV